MWPFAKLLNGFGSHMYIYSPTLLDSQVLSSQRCKKNTLASSTRTSTPGDVPELQTVFTCCWLASGNGMENGELPWCSRLRCSSPGSMMRVERVGFRQWNGVASQSASYLQLGQLLLCLWIGRGQWKWRMEKMFVDRCPGISWCGQLHPVLGLCLGTD